MYLVLRSLVAFVVPHSPHLLLALLLHRSMQGTAAKSKLAPPAAPKKAVNPKKDGNKDVDDEAPLKDSKAKKSEGKGEGEVPEAQEPAGKNTFALFGDLDALRKKD